MYKTCTFDGCERHHVAKGLCEPHYQQMKRSKPLTPIRPAHGRKRAKTEKDPCPICGEPIRARGLCNKHYTKSLRYKLTTDEVVALYVDPKCANRGCESTTRLHVDHNHITGRVRGLLCNTCNTALGLLGEDQMRIEGLVTYLESA